MNYQIKFVKDKIKSLVNKNKQLDSEIQNTSLQDAKNPNGQNGYAVITFLENIKDKRKNSNLYKDSYYQEHFDFNKLLEV